MDRIAIHDLTVLCRVGVSDEERANPQRLALTVEMEHDFAGLADRLDRPLITRPSASAWRALSAGEAGNSSRPLPCNWPK